MTKDYIEKRLQELREEYVKAGEGKRAFIRKGAELLKKQLEEIDESST
jgi:hypothetical protein